MMAFRGAFQTSRLAKCGSFGRFVRVLSFLFEVANDLSDLLITNQTLAPTSENLTMKMKKILLALALASTCLQQSNAQDNYQPLVNSVLSGPTASTAARHVGDGLESDREAEVSNPADLRPQSFRSGGRYVTSDSTTPPPQHTDYSTYSELAPTATSCGAACAPATGVMQTMSSLGWFEAESLLWFGQRRQSPPLVVSSPQGVIPIIGVPDVTSQLGGGDGISSGLLPGYRLSAGMYLDECEKIGIGGRVYGIFSSREEFSSTSTGTPSLAIPFYNTATNVNDSNVIAFRQGGGTLVADGTVVANSDLDMIGAEGSARFLMARSSDYRVDFLGGYTYNRLQDSIAINATSTDRFTGNLIADGTVFRTLDLFDADNTFHGGHLGLQTTIHRNRMSLASLLKVSFGNMHESIDITGFSVETTPGPNSTSTAYPGGVLTQQSNITSFERNQFAFIPELGAKLGYQVNCNLYLTCGYTFMYWSNVALAGRQIDSTVDFSQALGGAAGNRPAFNFQDSSFWMQGVDLGLTYSF